MTTLTAMRTAITDGIDALVPKGCTVRPYAGEFSPDKATKRISVPSPAVLTSFLGFNEAEDPGTGEVAVNTKWAAYVIGKGTRAHARDLDAIAMIDVLLPMLPTQYWGLGDQVGPPMLDIGDNLTTPAVETQGIAVYVVTWWQEAHLGQSVWTGDDPIPTQVLLGYAPEIGLAHEDDYVPVVDLPAEVVE